MRKKVVALSFMVALFMMEAAGQEPSVPTISCSDRTRQALKILAASFSEFPRIQFASSGDLMLVGNPESIVAMEQICNLFENVRPARVTITASYCIEVLGVYSERDVGPIAIAVSTFLFEDRVVAPHVGVRTVSWGADRQVFIVLGPPAEVDVVDAVIKSCLAFGREQSRHK